ncbi:MAG: glycosyltransferase, partial [Ignavibacteriales bacterium]|nr:glycosyltransferase [Ignavibacteriales bacterium]
PFTSEVPRLLRALDVLVVPSHSESFGYVAVEAMAMGIPVLGTKAGGLPEIVVDQETGFLVPPRDPAALAERLIILLKNKSLRSSMGKRGRRRALELFDFARSVEHLEEILVALPLRRRD